MAGSIPFIQLEGTPEVIGETFGRKFADRIRACYHFYTRELFADPNYDFKDQGLEYLAVIDRYFPEYAREMTSMAHGAGLEPWQIAVLNARSEIFIRANADLINECTSLYFPKTGLLGQNWDWMMPCENFMVLVEIRRENGHRFLTMTEAGILSKIGFNNKGLGICLNILFSNDPVFGVPIHILLRAALDSASIKDFKQILETVDYGCYSSILIAEHGGMSQTLEFDGKQHHTVDYGGDYPKHTNHYLYREKDDASLEHVANSLDRFAQVEELEGELDGRTIESMCRVLWRRDKGENSICKASAPLWHLNHGTVCTIIMDLAARVMHLTDGNPFDANFTFRQVALSQT